MNRKQRRTLAKQLGVTNKNLSYNDRLTSISDANKKGKVRQQKMAETKRLQEQEAKDLKESNDIASLATTIALRDSIPYFEAIKIATETKRVTKPQ